MSISPNIKSLQILRFISATLVIISHTYSRVLRTLDPVLVKNTFFSILYPIGHIGVDIFFVLSGFIMMYTNYNKFNSSCVKNFITKRFLRVAPLYWLITIVCVILLILCPSLFSYGQHLDLSWIVSSFLFLPSHSPSSGVFAPPLGLGWTINFEMYFYSVFAVGLYFKRHIALIGMSLFFISSCLCGYLFETTHPFIIQATSCLTFEFLIGCFLGYFFSNYHKFFKLFKVSSFLLLLIGLGFIYFGVTFLPNLTVSEDFGRGLHFERFIFFGLPSVSIVIFFLTFSDYFKSKILVELGNASYSLYLTQVLAIPFWSIVLSNSIHPVLFITYVILLSLGSGYIVYRVVEVPFRNYVKK